MDILVGVIVGLLVLMLLVTAHEFGHFIMARRNGVKVLEFGIGFPPKAIAWVKDAKTGKWKRLPKSEWKKPQKGLIFSLNWLPIGGFCQMDGESAEDERAGTFGAASFWTKTKILFGGVAMNWLLAFVILTILAWTGMPEFLEGQFTIDSDTRRNDIAVVVEKVAEGSPAEKAGFLEGDKIIKIGGESFTRLADFAAYNEVHAGEVANYTVLRYGTGYCDGKMTVKECEPTEHEQDLLAQLNGTEAEYLLGVSMWAEEGLSYSTWSAPIVGAGLTLQITGETFKGLGDLVWNLISGVGAQLSFDSSVRDAGKESISTVGESVSGPVGIIGTLFPSFTAAGPTNLAFLAAIISISLACMNVLPIPALDGGRWLLIAIYKIRKKKLTKEIEEKIVSRAFMVLLAIMFIITILDVVRIVK
ncbi:MAG: M50 family metallopeptidase [Candidatus Saccharibacteria bacterium]|nr:M50 family metallopeptidase [Candidatus Saccharibacteria bacterium]